MKYFKSLHELDSSINDCVLAIGNFDGVHRGHQALIGEAKRIADEHQKHVGILTFEPHPRALFRPDERPFRITPENMKRRQLESCNIDFTLSHPFDWDFASQSADNFIDHVLKPLNPSHIIVGYDFRFGQLRKGSAETLKDAGFEVTVLNAITYEKDAPVSSSQIRQYIRHGDIAAANDLLGWDWEIEGVVQKGDQRGRELGYPTANIPMTDIVHPAYGIYATLINIEGDDVWHKSATNIGIRPMFEIPTAQIETFIFNFDEDIYGKTVRVKPVEYIRGEAKFDSLDALIDQMEKDCQTAQNILTA